MSENRLHGRIVNKHDIEANWLKATNFIPMLGEIIVYDADEDHPRPRFKSGDGKTIVSLLPFSEAEVELDEFIGATAEDDGEKGAVPAPLAGDQDKYLRADGTWSDILMPGDETSSDSIAAIGIHADTADIAYDAEKLGGIAASKYALKSEIPSGTGGGTGSGSPGVTFTPYVSADGVLSWTNNGGLDNPDPVNVKPVKGTDYWTAEDQTEMVNAVLAAIPDASGVGF